MTKKNSIKFKSFTLIEVLVSVAIFATVSLIVMSTLSSGLGVKAKIVALNDLRKEGAAVMVEIQDMVEKGNGSSTSELADRPAVAIMSTDDVDLNNPTYASQPNCNNAEDVEDKFGVYSYQTDKKNWQVRRAVAVRSGQLMQKKQILNSSGGVVAESGWLPLINSSSIELVEFRVSGYFRNLDPVLATKCTQIATKINIYLKLRSKNTNLTGEQSTIILDSTFTPKHPGPDKSEDAI